MDSQQAAPAAAAQGAAPHGAKDPRAASNAVREMFSAIAPRYDLLNHVLSCNIDKLWWRRAARTFDDVLRRPDAQILDLCCGTCDMTLNLQRRAQQLRGPEASSAMLAADFARPMLARAAKKIHGKNIRLLEADALQLPFADRQFDLVVSAFGFRNLADYDAGLREIHRILRPGGEVGLLDFSEPDGLLGSVYKIYFRHVLPRIGRLVSGVSGPYAYLPASVERFPTPPQMVEHMRACGFREAQWQPYSFGIAGLFRATKD